MHKVVWHWQATCIHGNLFTNILCIYIHTIGQGHQHGHCRGIGIGLRQGMTVATYKVLQHRQATLICENFQSVLALATNSYLWQMTKCFGISSQLLFTAINKVHWHWQKNIWSNTPCIYLYLLQQENKGIEHRHWHWHWHQHDHEC